MKNVIYAIVFLSLFSCKDKGTGTIAPEEDLAAKKTLQGVWTNTEDGCPEFRVDGDTIFYPDGESEPVAFSISNDSLHLSTSTPVSYAIKKISGNLFVFINSAGDEIKLQKSTGKSDLAHFVKEEKKEEVINQRTLIKRDSVMFVGDKRFHAYTQVNPTTYKVYHQSINEDGMTVENAYFDNFVNVTVYQGANRVYRHDFSKGDFAKYVPQQYISHCILSDILINKATEKGIEFEAILAEPETYTSYRIIININQNGRISFSV